jgi:hypothetical protein
VHAFLCNNGERNERFVKLSETDGARDLRRFTGRSLIRIADTRAYHRADNLATPATVISITSAQVDLILISLMNDYRLINCQQRGNGVFALELARCRLFSSATLDPTARRWIDNEVESPHECLKAYG